MDGNVSIQSRCSRELSSLNGPPLFDTREVVQKWLTFFMLKGLRILSFCHYLQGPAASQYLADLGAEVVKVEPLSGAHERRWSGAKSFVGRVSSFYLCGNRNKRSLAINLKHDRAKVLIEKLVTRSDAIIENFPSWCDGPPRPRIRRH